MSAALALLFTCLILEQSEPEILRIGETRSGRVDVDDAGVEADGLAPTRGDGPARGARFRLEDAATGAVTVTLRSIHFDAYLVARDGDGVVLAEDDNGWYWLHARLVVPSGARPPVTVLAVARGGRTGAFEIAAARGVHAPLPRERQGERLVAEVASLLEDLPAVRDPDVLAAYARFLSANDRRDEAHLLLEQALSAETERFGPRHPRVLGRLSALAEALVDAEEFEAALPLLDRLVTTSQEVSGPAAPVTSNRRRRLTSLLGRLGRHAEALTLLERDHAYREETLPPSHPAIVDSLNALATTSMELRRYDEAQALYERALSILEEAGRAGGDDAATVLSNLGSLHHYEGRFDAARQCYERALEIETERRDPMDPSLSGNLSNLGLLLHDMGLHRDALPLLERALAIDERHQGRRHSQTATTLGNLGVVLTALGRKDEARRAHERELSIREEVLGPDHPQTLMSMNNLSPLLEDLGRREEALVLQRRACATAEEVLGPTDPITGRLLNNLAMRLRLGGRLDEAQAMFERCVNIHEAQLGPHHPNTATTWNNLAVCRLDAGAFEAAREAALHAAVGIGRHLAEQGADLSVGRRLRAQAALFWHLETVLSADRDAREPHPDVVATALTWKGQARRMGEARADLRTGLGVEERALLRRVQALSSRLSTLTAATEVDDPVDHRAEIEEVRRALTRADEELKRRVKLPRDWRSIDAASIRAALPPGSAFVDLLVHGVYEPARWEDGELVRAGAWREGRVTAFVHRPDRERTARVELGSIDELGPALRSPRAWTDSARGSAPRVRADGGDGGEALREKLWDPLIPHLGGARHVILSPDGALGTIPWGALPDGKGAFLLEETTFTYVPDPGALLRARGASDGPAASGALVAGGFDYEHAVEPDPTPDAEGRRGPRDGRIDRTWPSLPRSGEEAERVARLFESTPGYRGTAEVLVGADGSEQRIKRLVEGRRFVHLATHGYFQPPELPSPREWILEDRSADRAAERIEGLVPGLLSGLVCAGAAAPVERGQDNGLLTASEVSWLDLSGCDLVVLSACETAIGEPRAGEGMISLQSAFHAAGARTVIASLWKVPDDATAELMQRFYTRLWGEGQSKGEALRGAKLDLLAENRKRLGSALPSTWGAFVLSGDWE